MIDFRSLEQELIQGQVGVVNRWGAKAKVVARQRAPVRKVFKGQSASERIRAKTADEIAPDRAIRRRLGLGPEFEPLNREGVAPATILTRFAPQDLGARAVTPASDKYTGRRIPPRMVSLVSQGRLDRRGRYELR